MVELAFEAALRMNEILLEELRGWGMAFPAEGTAQAKNSARKRNGQGRAQWHWSRDD